MVEGRLGAEMPDEGEDAGERQAEAYARVWPLRGPLCSRGRPGYSQMRSRVHVIGLRPAVSELKETSGVQYRAATRASRDKGPVDAH